MGWKWPTPCLGPWKSSLISHLVLMCYSWEAPSLRSCPKLEGPSGSPQRDAREAKFNYASGFMYRACQECIDPLG